jgi:hypothetical protein
VENKLIKYFLFIFVMLSLALVFIVSMSLFGAFLFYPSTFFNPNSVEGYFLLISTFITIICFVPKGIRYLYKWR